MIEDIGYIEYIKNIIIENKTLILGLIICIALVSIVFYKKIERYSSADDAKLKELDKAIQEESEEEASRNLHCTKGCMEDKNLLALFQRLAQKNLAKFCRKKCITQLAFANLMNKCNKEKCIKGRIAGSARDKCLKDGEFKEECLGSLFTVCDDPDA